MYLKKENVGTEGGQKNKLRLTCLIEEKPKEFMTQVMKNMKTAITYMKKKASQHHRCLKEEYYELHPLCGIIQVEKGSQKMYKTLSCLCLLITLLVLKK